MTPIAHHFTNLPPDNGTLTLTIISGDEIRLSHYRPDDDTDESTLVTPVDLIRMFDL